MIRMDKSSSSVSVRVQEGVESCSTESHDYSDAEDECWHSSHTSNGGGASDDEQNDDDEEEEEEEDPEIADLDLEKGPELEELKEAGNHLGPSGVREKGQLEVSESGIGGEKECRICHLGVEAEAGTSIVLGCACKDDLAVSHKHCAEAWFKIKGNRLRRFEIHIKSVGIVGEGKFSHQRTCEICGSIARNVVGIEEADFMDQWNEGSTTTTTTEPRNFWRGHRFLNFLLACMILAFVISWFFHFNIPS